MASADSNNNATTTFTWLAKNKLLLPLARWHGRVTSLACPPAFWLAFWLCVPLANNNASSNNNNSNGREPASIWSASLLLGLCGRF